MGFKSFIIFCCLASIKHPIKPIVFKPNYFAFFVPSRSSIIKILAPNSLLITIASASPLSNYISNSATKLKSNATYIFIRDVF